MIRTPGSFSWIGVQTIVHWYGVHWRSGHFITFEITMTIIFEILSGMHLLHSSLCSTPVLTAVLCVQLRDLIFIPGRIIVIILITILWWKTNMLEYILGKTFLSFIKAGLKSTTKIAGHVQMSNVRPATNVMSKHSDWHAVLRGRLMILMTINEA